MKNHTINGGLNMKPTENYDQLMERFVKRIIQLTSRKTELKDSYDEYIKISEDIKRLEGSIHVVEYLRSGKLPNDGNHTGMKDHKPQ